MTLPFVDYFKKTSTLGYILTQGLKGIVFYSLVEFQMVYPVTGEKAITRDIFELSLPSHLRALTIESSNFQTRIPIILSHKQVSM